MKRMLLCFLALFLLVACTASPLPSSSPSSSEVPASPSPSPDDVDTGSVSVISLENLIEPSLISTFELESGHEIVHHVVSSAEELYAEVSGPNAYDVVIAPDYIVDRLRTENLLSALNYAGLPLSAAQMARFTSPYYDPDGAYSIAYLWDTLGLVYSSLAVEWAVDSWSALFDDGSAGGILMSGDRRDNVSAALKYLGYSVNTASEAELRAAFTLLGQQKPLVQAYDDALVSEKMLSGEAVAALVRSATALRLASEDETLSYVLPREGAPLFVQALCIPASCQNVKAAEVYVNYLCSVTAGIANCAYTRYNTPIQTVYDELDESAKSAYPSEQELARCEAYTTLSAQTAALYDSLWTELMNS